MNLKNLLDDANFVNELDQSLEIILKDNKINEYDVPEIVFIITNIIDKEPKIKLNRNNLKIMKKFQKNNAKVLID